MTMHAPVDQPIDTLIAAAADAAVARAPAAPVRIDSAALLQGAQEIEIAHKGALYRLRETSLGKLILTK